MCKNLHLTNVPEKRSKSHGSSKYEKNIYEKNNKYSTRNV